MKSHVITIALFTFIATCTVPAAAEQPVILPVEEGWVNGASNAPWSRKNPDTLGARRRSTDTAWATYLMFELPDDVASLAGRNLVLQFAKPENGELESKGTFSLFGSTEAHWIADSLNAQNAPAWDESVFDVGDDAVMLASQVIYNPGTEELSFPIDGDFLEFCRENAGRTVTLVITKEGHWRTSIFHSNRGNPEAGPRIR